MLQTAIILAGGFGTRLQTVISDVPKPMAPVLSEPFLNYQLRYLKHFGLKKIILSVGYLADKVQEHYKNNYLGLDIDYSVEDTPLGTGGGIRKSLEACKDELALVLNGDSFFDCDLHEFLKLHINEQADASLALRKVSNASRYGQIETNSNDSIISFREKSAGETSEGLINAGVYILNKAAYLAHTAPEANFSIEKDFFEKKLQDLQVKGFEFPGYFIDIGIPEDYSKAQIDFKGFKY